MDDNVWVPPDWGGEVGVHWGCQSIVPPICLLSKTAGAEVLGLLQGKTTDWPLPLYTA